MEIRNYIFELLKERAIQILPKEEIKYLPEVSELDNSIVPFFDLIFVLERFIKSKILPLKFEIVYSSSFDKSELPDKAVNNLRKLERMLLTGDIKVNDFSQGFLPKSAKSYLSDYYGLNKKRRYVVDFTSQFFGIKHFHLDSHNTKENILLYYVIMDRKIYFLKIGKHQDLYTQVLVENLINEFPEIINQLGVYVMPDMPVGEKFEYSIDKVKTDWISGSNVSFHINNQYYTSVNLQTFSRLNTEIVNITNNIIYQFKENLRQFYLNNNELNNNSKIVPLRYEDGEFFKNGNILIGDKISKIATEIRIDYLERLKFVDVMLNAII